MFGDVPEHVFHFQLAVYVAAVFAYASDLCILPVPFAPIHEALPVPFAPIHEANKSAVVDGSPALSLTPM